MHFTGYFIVWTGLGQTFAQGKAVFYVSAVLCERSQVVMFLTWFKLWVHSSWAQGKLTVRLW